MAQTQSGDAGTQMKSSIPKTDAPTLVLSPTTAAALLCQMLSFVAVLVEHPCPRSLANESWTPLLLSVVSVIGQPRDVTKQLELAHTALHDVLGVRDAGVVPPGVWRELALRTMAQLSAARRGGVPRSRCPSRPSPAAPPTTPLSSSRTYDW